VEEVTSRRTSCFMLQPRSINSAASQ